MSEQDVKDASAGVLKDLKRFQLEKEDDFKRYMVGPTDLRLSGKFADVPPTDCICKVSHRLG